MRFRALELHYHLKDILPHSNSLSQEKRILRAKFLLYECFLILVHLSSVHYVRIVEVNLAYLKFEKEEIKLLLCIGRFFGLQRKTIHYGRIIPFQSLAKKGPPNGIQSLIYT